MLAYHSTEYRQSTKKKQLSRLNSDAIDAKKGEKAEEEENALLLLLYKRIYERCIVTQRFYFFLDYINLIVYKDKLEKIKTEKKKEK